MYCYGVFLQTVIQEGGYVSVLRIKLTGILVDIWIFSTLNHQLLHKSWDQESPTKKQAASRLPALPFFPLMNLPCNLQASLPLPPMCKFHCLFCEPLSQSNLCSFPIYLSLPILRWYLCSLWSQWNGDKVLHEHRQVTLENQSFSLWTQFYSSPAASPQTCTLSFRFLRYKMEIIARIATAE